MGAKDRHPADARLQERVTDTPRPNLHNDDQCGSSSSVDKSSSSLNDSLRDVDQRSNPSDDGETKTKKGVVYLSRIPPFMGVTKLRQYMSSFGAVERIYLTPENPVTRKKRLIAGGSKKEMFRDGWIEFQDKKVAKFVGSQLNNTPVGGPKRHNFWRDDIWNLRYLPKFQWHHLLEYHTGKKKAREAKRQAELLQIRRENAHYMDQVQRKRKLDLITSERKKRKEKRDSQAVS